MKLLLLAAILLSACGGAEPTQPGTVTTNGAAPSDGPFAGWPTSADVSKASP